MAMATRAFVGLIVHSLGNPDQLDVHENAVLVVKDGKIACLEPEERLPELIEQYQISEANIVKMTKGQFVMPGLVDTHVHAPQYPNVGLGYDKTLLEWLDTYTFPLEASYSDAAFAEKVYQAVVRRTLKAGTTTACYFATIHKDSTLVLARQCAAQGQRALVGKVNMNANSPDNYIETTEASVRDTEGFIQEIRALGVARVQPVITPRFAISCDANLMLQLGEIAQKLDVHIQTHISENKGEIEFVKELFPDCKNYAEVYEKAKLLTKKTVLAHGVYLLDEELQLLSKIGTSVSHCPNSNTSLQSGMCDVKRLLKYNVKVGLGTDMSGGYGHSIMDAMRQALSVSTCISFNKENYKPLDFQQVIHLATLGGAEALALDEITGNFAVGKEFDALLVDMNAGPSDLIKDYSALELLQKFVYLADDRNVKQVYVAGTLAQL
ncbi:guanine deaminase [Cloeon dipterum]|uniref:guanine deaminase n=1 Tax=Cloeon dipterum TaxID=197152 RepID=UPI00321FF675